MNVQQLKTQLNNELDQHLVDARVLLNNMRVIEEKSRRSFAYLDDRYTPFYYYLGKCIQPKSLLKIGFRLGLLGGCFLKSCRSVERFLGFQEKKKDEYYSPRLGVSNIKDAKPFPNVVDVYVGDFLDCDFSKLMTSMKWDLVLINDESTHDKLRLYLDSAWDNASEGGLIIVDYVNYHNPTSDVYKDFCKVKNREPVIVNSRYGVGLIER